MRFFRWVPPIVWSLAILFLTSIPNPQIDAPEDSDKVLHFGVYAILGILTARAARLQRNEIALALTIMGGIIVFGAIDEWHQKFIPGRYPAVDDWIADSIGGIVGTLLTLAGAFWRRSQPA